jgi:hypothetical protein
MTFTELLKEYLGLLENVQKPYGPVWERLQQVEKELDAMVPPPGDPS